MAIVGVAIVLGIPTQRIAQSMDTDSAGILPSQVDTSAFPTLNGSDAIVNTGALNIRSGPGPGYAVITIAYQGTAVTLLGRHAESNWVKIRLNNGTEGWVNSYYIHAGIYTDTLPIIEDFQSFEPASTTPSTIIVATGALNLRSSPTLADNILTVLRRGERLLPLGKNEVGSWLLVRSTTGVEGWVNSSYLHIGIQIAELPLIPLTPPGLTARIVLDAVNVHNGPGGISDSFAVLRRGRTVNIVGHSSDGQWIQIQTKNGVSGWVTTAAFQNDVIAHSLPTADAIESASSAIVATAALNVRYGPGTDFEIITTLFRDDPVTMLGRALYSNWVKVELSDGAQGWVNSRYLSGHHSIDLLPVAWP